MNRLIFITLFTTLIFTACTSTPKSYVVEGVVPDASYNNQMVYMYDYENRKQVDSAMVTDEKFTFTGSVDTAVIRRLALKRLYANFILENGKISVDMATPESAKGTLLNEELSKFQIEFDSLIEASREDYGKIRQNQVIDEETRKKQVDENIKRYTIKIDSLCSKVFNANKNNAMGTFVLWNWSNSLTPDQLDSVYAQAGDVVRKFKVLQSIIETNAKAKQTAAGMPFTDFIIENGNKDGSKVSLSDYVGKGKYVLVDFWASWCGPCIGEIPVIGEVYNKYKGDKFEVLGVAVWDEREETLKAIEKHNITWPTILDAGSIPTELYGISGIPHIILFGPDGTIIARELRGDGLKAKVAEVMQ